MTFTWVLIATAIMAGVAVGTIYCMVRASSIFPVRESVSFRNGLWHWTMTTKGGEVIAESTEGYTEPRHARNAVRMVIVEGLQQ